MEHNLLKIPETIKYIREEKNKKYYPNSGLETYIGDQRKSARQLQQRNELNR